VAGIGSVHIPVQLDFTPVRFEYAVEFVANKGQVQRSALLNSMAADGWRFAQSDDDYYVFERINSNEPVPPV
jgi:hypothetical protein